MTDITQKLGFDAASAIASLRSLSDALNQANANMRNLANSSREFVSKTQGMSAALATMGRNAQNISKMLTQLGYNAKTTGTSLAAVGNAGKSGFAAAMQRFDALAAKAKATAAATAAAAAKAQSTPAAKPAASGLSALGSSLSKLAGQGALNLLTQGFRAFTASIWPAVQAAREFGLAITEIQTIAQKTGLDAKGLTDAVMTLSTELGKPAKDVAEGLYQVLSNQVVEARDAIGFLAEAEKLAITTHASTAQAVDALSSVMNSYGLQAHEAARASDILFETVFIGRLRLGDIADRIGRITPMAAQMGVRFEEVGAAIAVMTVQGVKADTAITQLRAIMSKLMKPTEELTKIFKSWGVTDGEAALRAFGGIEGVLRKLSQEVGGSTAEMAEFFNVVRAMTGVMSVGTEEGQKFRDAIEDLEQSSGKAAAAWAIFEAAPAQRLTVALNETKNAMLELGATIGPVVGWFLEGFNRILKGVKQSWEGLKGLVSDSSFAKSVAERLEAQRVEAIKNATKVESQFNNAAWRERETSYRAHVAEMNAITQGATAGIIAKQSVANEVLKNASSTLMSEFEKSYSHLADFVNNSTQRMEDGLRVIADLKKSAAEIRFDVKLDQARTPAAKLGLLMGDFNKKLKEAKTLADGVGVDPEKLKVAMAAFETALKANEKVAAQQAANGDVRKSQITQLRSAAIIDEQVRLQEKFNATEKERIPLATKELASLEARKVAIGDLFKTQQELLAQQGAGAGSRTATQDKQLQDKINSVTQQLADAVKGLGADQAILDSLQIESTVGKFEKTFINSFANMNIDWSVQTDSLKAELEKLQIKLLVDLQVDPGTIQQFKGTPLERGIGEGAADWIDRVLQATTKAGDSLSEAQNKLTDAEKNSNSARAKIANEVNAQAKLTVDLAAQLRDDSQTTVSFMGQMFNLNLAQDFYDLVSGGSVEARLNTGKLMAEFKNNLAAIGAEADQAGGMSSLAENTLALMGERIAKAMEAGEIENGIGESMKRQIQAIRDLNTARKEEKTFTEQQLKAQQKLEDTKPFQKDVRATKVDTKALEAIGKEVELDQRAVDALNTDLTQSKQVADSFSASTQVAKTAVQNTGTAQSNLTGAVAGTTAGIWNEVTAQNALLAAVQATNAAKAAGSVGGETTTAYSGGMINYLAAGGRGQDNIATMLSKGEYVSSARTAGKFFSELNAMNNGSRPVYREQGGSVTNVGDVNVTVNGGESSQATVREIGQALRREIQRGNIKLK